VSDYQTEPSVLSSRSSAHKQREKEEIEPLIKNKNKNNDSSTSSESSSNAVALQEPPKQSNNIFVLWMTILIVSVCTIALAVAAVFSHSLALTADVVQNAVDLSTYGVNLYAEYQAEAERASGAGASARGKRLELAAACFSVAGLIAVGCWVLWAALDRFHTASMPGHAVAGGAHVNPYILLIFTCLGFAADMVTATLFCMYSESSVEETSTAGPLLDLEGTQQSQQKQSPKRKKNVNMISAGAHVMTDAIRSITIVVGAFLIYLQHQKVIHLHMQEEVMDGVLSCFVVGCMGIAVLFVLREIYQLLREQVDETGSMSKFICRPSDLPQKKGGDRDVTGEVIAWRQSRSTAVDL
jgi:Co/Zn/Cd efflux system component